MQTKPLPITVTKPIATTPTATTPIATKPILLIALLAADVEPYAIAAFREKG